jgi:hypothetical protein
MNDISERQFLEAIGEMYTGRETVREIFDGEVVGEGEVLTFSLREHPEATTCYAWEVDGQVTAVLGVPPVRSALDAVRAFDHGR